MWVLRSTLKDEATDTTLAPGEGISSDHTFLLRHQQRAIVIHVPLSYQLSPLDVGSRDLSPGRTGTVESLSVATVIRGRRKPSAMPGADTPPGAVIVNPRFTDVASLKAEHWENP